MLEQNLRNEFKHEPLHASTRSIRLISIAPSEHYEEPFSCTLDLTSLDDAPGYIALSYTWGDPHDTEAILVQGKRFLVTRNLCECLRHLKKTKEQLKIWIDGICIDQTNNRERSQQVLLMGEIYQRANEVWIWLGESSDMDSSALSVLDDVAALADTSRDTATRSLSELLSDPSRARGWTALGSLFYRQWWYRSWIIQEITFAKKATVICGQWRIQWDQLSKFETNMGIDLECMPAACRLRNVYRSYPFDLNSLASLLLLTRSCKATDARDKIYAFLNLLTERSTYIDIDYDLTTCEVYMQVARHFREKSRKLDFLSWDECGNASSSHYLPSWTPDWSTPLSDNIRLLAPGYHSDPEMWSTLYQATANSEAEGFLDLKAMTLNMQGFRIDTIASMTSTCTTVDLAWVEEARNFLGIGLASSNHADVQTLWRLLLADQWSHDERLSNGPISFRDPVLPGKEDILSKVNANTTLAACLGRKLFVSSCYGYSGLAPANANVGDRICGLLGGSVPYVLSSSDVTNTFVGECYLDGMMDGQALEGLKDGRFVLENFSLQ